MGGKGLDLPTTPGLAYCPRRRAAQRCAAGRVVVAASSPLDSLFAALSQAGSAALSGSAKKGAAEKAALLASLGSDRGIACKAAQRKVIEEKVDALVAAAGQKVTTGVRDSG